jgi:ubiquitin-protein ligase E3 C
VHIMRTRVLEDGLIHLNKLGSDLRKRIIVHYVNAAGATESGLDAGGLFKEFWTDLSNQSLNPNWALFRETEGKSFFNVLYKWYAWFHVNILI